MSSRSSSRFTVALIVWGLLCLLYVAEFHLTSIISVIFVGIALALQNRFAVGRRGVGIITVVALLLCFLCTRALSYGHTGMFLGIGTMSLTLLASWLTGVSLMVQLTKATTRLPLFFGCAALIGCSMTIYLKLTVLLAVPAIIFLVLALRESLGLPATPRLLGPLLVTLALASTLVGTATWSESRLSFLMSFFSLMPPSGHSFPIATSLSSIQRWNNSDVVVLRGYGKNPPLYLVGRTFEEFDKTNFWRWNTTKQEIAPTRQALMQTSSGPKAVSLFTYQGGDEGYGGPFRMEYPNSGRGLTLYHPREFYGVAADIPRLHLYSDGMLQALAKDDLNGEYFLLPFSDGWDDNAAVTPLTPEEKELYLQSPENLTPEIARLAKEIVGDERSAERKADFVTAYLQQNFKYGYDYPFKSSESALEEFLLKRPPAHCEFFATSAALMLRSQGVPTRYITGFVLQESSLGGEYYVVRLKHAHAWIEAYIPEKGWVTYDPTPPGTLGEADDRGDFSKSLLELASNMWRRFTNFFTLSPAQMIDEVKAFFAGLDRWDYLKLIALLGLWFFWKRYRKGAVKRKTSSVRDYIYQPARHERLTPLLNRIEEAISDRELHRVPSETPVAWAERLETSALPDSLKSDLLAFSHHYTRARYRAQTSAEEMAELEERSTALAEELAGL